MTLAEIATLTGGEVHEGEGGAPAERLLVDGPAYVDTRAAAPRGLFVALVGERVDGHEYAAGAHAVLGSRPTAAPTVVVTDVVAALGRLARHVRDRLGVQVLALTGSQGKTGTKDLLAHVLGGAGPTVATAANQNNELGVPLTVLRAEESTAHLVVEMGARGTGHVAYLCEVARPDVAAVLNVGTAHIGEFGSPEAIATAKGEIVASLAPDGTAVLNADDAHVAAMRSWTRARVLTFGEHADVAWRDPVLDDLGRPSFELGHAGTWAPVTLRQTGQHQVWNAAAAAAMALAAGMTLEQVAAGLSGAEAASRWRMELTERADGLLVLNDAYNANPASMAAALRALAGLGAPRPGRAVAVLGEMLELGEEAPAAHREVGAVAARVGVGAVVVVGAGADGIADGARSGGVPEVVRAAGRDDALRWVRQNATAADVVLVKASRGAALEWVAAELMTDEPPGEGAGGP